MKEPEFSTRTGKIYFMRAEPHGAAAAKEVDAIIGRETHVYDLAFTFFLTRCCFARKWNTKLGMLTPQASYRYLQASFYSQKHAEITFISVPVLSLTDCRVSLSSASHV